MWNSARTIYLIANLLASAAVLAMAFALLAWLAQRPMFALASIELLPASAASSAGSNEPLHYVSAARVRSAIAGRLVGNFFTLNLDQARAAFESVPWVRRASVRRVWPNTLRVVLEEQQPLGVWNETQLINAWGETFTVNQGELDDDVNLPLFVGPDGAQKLMVQRYVELAHWLRPLDAQVDRIELTPRYAWVVKLSNGMTLDLGRDPSAEQVGLTVADRMARFARAWPELQRRLEGRSVTRVDLRYGHGFALTLLAALPTSQPKKVVIYEP